METSTRMGDTLEEDIRCSIPIFVGEEMEVSLGRADSGVAVQEDQ